MIDCKQMLLLLKGGKDHAKNLAKELLDVHFDAVFSSDLTRTRQTAEILALERKLAVETTELLRERTFGKLEGKATSELRAIHAELIKLEDEEIFSSSSVSSIPVPSSSSSSLDCL